MHGVKSATVAAIARDREIKFLDFFLVCSQFKVKCLACFVSMRSFLRLQMKFLFSQVLRSK